MHVWLFVGGMVLGILAAVCVHALATIGGKLLIDHSNPTKDVYRFEISKLDKLTKKKYMLLTIDHNADLSQE